MKRILLVMPLFLLMSGCGFQGAKTSEASAQALIHVDSDYRVVTVEPARYQIGIALTDANPYHVQNYVHLHLDTQVTRTVYGDNGWVRYEHLTPQSFLATVVPGAIIHVRGGRDWDNTIVAKKISY